MFVVLRYYCLKIDFCNKYLIDYLKAQFMVPGCALALMERVMAKSSDLESSLMDNRVEVGTKAEKK